jgi:hypothetical protein
VFGLDMAGEFSDLTLHSVSVFILSDFPVTIIISIKIIFIRQKIQYLYVLEFVDNDTGMIHRCMRELEHRPGGH